MIVGIHLYVHRLALHIGHALGYQNLPIGAELLADQATG